MHGVLKGLPCVTVLALMLSSPVLPQEADEAEPPARAADMTAEERAQGRLLFEAHCARCHGMGGTGGEGPSLTRPILNRAADDQGLVALVQQGVPAAGMPANWMLSTSEAWRIAAYVRSLAEVEPVPASGDAGAGRLVYEEQGCEACHVLDGVGRGLGPELTLIGAQRGAQHLRQELVDPGARVADEYRLMRLRIRDGLVLRGLRVNEDAFTVQIRDENNRFHSFEKRDLAEVVHQPEQSIMPSYGRRLTARELDDLVAYLASLRGGEGEESAP